VPEPPQYLLARRASRRAQIQRRRRLTALSGLLVVALAAAAVVAVSLRGAVARAHRRPVPALGARVPPRPPKLGPAAVSAQIAARIRRLAAYGLPLYCAGPHGNAVAFTFDDGPGPYTYLALRKLTQAHEQATFFVVGRSMDNFPGWVVRELKVAAIGDHTYHHLYLPALTAAQISSEITSTAQKITENTGEPVLLFRPPYGGRNAVVDAAARKLGLLEVLWSVDSRDSLGANWAGIIANVEAGLRPGAIILMHENRGQTIRALTTLLPYLHAHHLRSVSVPELLASDPPTVAQLRAGALGCGAARASLTGS
jgi:peptidoglycan/xylan/chitin deacetylase (PgdA/CDA1 family)